MPGHVYRTLLFYRQQDLRRSTASRTPGLLLCKIAEIWLEKWAEQMRDLAPRHASMSIIETERANGGKPLHAASTPQSARTCRGRWADAGISTAGDHT
jgi:hypothetical protein